MGKASGASQSRVDKHVAHRADSGSVSFLVLVSNLHNMLHVVTGKVDVP